MHEYFACVYVCEPHVCLASLEIRRGHRIFWDWSGRRMLAGSMWNWTQVSEGAANALNLHAFSLVLPLWWPNTPHPRHPLTYPLVTGMNLRRVLEGFCPPPCAKAGSFSTDFQMFLHPSSWVAVSGDWMRRKQLSLRCFCFRCYGFGVTLRWRTWKSRLKFPGSSQETPCWASVLLSMISQDFAFWGWTCLFELVFMAHGEQLQLHCASPRRCSIHLLFVL